MATTPEVTWERALGRRLRRLHLLAPAPDLLAAASRLCGVHAQVASAAELIVGVRTAGFRPSDVDDALWTRRTLVKTWGMRGTLHLFPAAEFPAWVAAFRQRQWPRFTPAWEKYHGVSPDELRAITSAVADVLPGKVLTREELAGAVAGALGAPHLAERIRSGWGSMLKPAAAGGLLCFGPNDGRNVTFTDPRTVVSDWREPDQDTAIRTVISRFLDVHGPATHEDFGRWWGTDAASARKLFARHRDALTQVELAGRKAWTTPEAAAELAEADPAAGVWLLPGFDPYVIAPLSHRVRTIPDGKVSEVSRTAGWISPVLVADGLVRGVWSYKRSGGKLAVEVTPFAPLDGATRQAAASHAERYADLLGGALTLTWND